MKSNTEWKSSVDWDLLQKDLGIVEQGDAEAIVHEIAHMVELCPEGDPRFPPWCGTQKEVSARVDDHYGEGSLQWEIAEVRTTAITILALESLGLESYAVCKSMMLKNLTTKMLESDPHPTELLNDFLLDARVALLAKCIVQDLDTNYTFPEDEDTE